MKHVCLYCRKSGIVYLVWKEEEKESWVLCLQLATHCRPHKDTYKFTVDVTFIRVVV
jgi:hypothetical protein